MIISKAQKFQQMAEVLSRIQRMIEREGGEPSEVRERLAGVLVQLGVDLEVARLLDPETLAETLAGDVGKLWGVAEVLYLDAHLALAEERASEARVWLEKARRLYERVEPGLELPEGSAAPEARLRRIDGLLA